jgi:hypothetical protein
MNSVQKLLFDQKLDARLAQGFLYLAKNAAGQWSVTAAPASYAKMVELYIDGYNNGRVSDSAFEIVEREMVASGDLRAIAAEAEEPELTVEQYRAMPVRQIQLKYRSDPAFKAGVEKLIAEGKI